LLLQRRQKQKNNNHGFGHLRSKKHKHMLQYRKQGLLKVNIYLSLLLSYWLCRYVL
jgi:hypothetical protein